MTDQPMSETARRYRERNGGAKLDTEASVLPADLEARVENATLLLLERIAAALEKIAGRP